MNESLPPHAIVAAILAAHLPGGNAENVARDVVLGLRRAGFALVAVPMAGSGP